MLTIQRANGEPLSGPVTLDQAREWLQKASGVAFAVLVRDGVVCYVWARGTLRACRGVQI